MPVVTIGEIVVDWLSLEPGDDLLHARNFHRALGGNASNVAVGLNRLGTPVRLIAKTGADFHAQYLRGELERLGLDSSHVLADERYPTAQCYMTTAADGEHHYRNWPRPHSADMLSPDEISEDIFDNVRFLHATGISFVVEPRRNAIQRALDIARDRKIPISFDGLFPTGWVQEAHDYVEFALYQAQLIKLNEFELNFWAGSPTPHTVRDAAERCFERYKPVALFITQAERGSFVMTEKGVVECAPVAVKCVCGVGAGDAYIAGVLHALYNRHLNVDLSHLTNADWQRIGMAGNFTGASATQSIDGNSGVPSGSALAAYMGW
jgi:sugar/nucleoside kinase (ribokinase family)